MPTTTGSGGAGPAGAGPRWVGGDLIRETLSPRAVADAIEAALLSGLGASSGAPRAVVEVAAGSLLLMPAAGPRWVGTKLVTVAPDNPSRGFPLVQATYLLMDAATLTPVALLDGTALTTLRTPAVSVVALRHLRPPGARTVVVFGSGTQARGHVEALLAEGPLAEVVVVGRDPGRAVGLVEHARALGVDARLGTAADVALADVVVCATTADAPVLDGSLVRPDAVVVAVGSYQPHTREVGSDLVARSTVVVEDVVAARTEDGVVMLAEAEGSVVPERLVSLSDLVRGRAETPAGRPALFTGVGRAWQDLVVAGALWEALAPPATP